MAFKCTLFVLALALAAVCAEEVLLNDDQKYVLNGRVKDCLKDVTAASGLVDARSTCTTRGVLATDFTPGLSGVIPAVVKCLNTFKVPAAEVSKVEQCLTTSLAKPL